MVKINVFIPKNVNKDERKILEKLQKAESFMVTQEKSFFDKMKNMFE